MLTIYSHRRHLLSAILPVLACLVAALPDQARGEETDIVTIAFEVFPSSPESALALIDRFENDAVGVVTDVPPENSLSDSFDLLCDGEYLGTFSNHGYMLFVTKRDTFKLRGYVHEIILPANRHGFMRLGPNSGATIDVLPVVGFSRDQTCVDPESPNSWHHLLIVVTGSLSR